MVAFRLPANSRVRSGKTWPAPAAPSRLRQFRVYRWNPDAGANHLACTTPIAAIKG